MISQKEASASVTTQNGISSTGGDIPVWPMGTGEPYDMIGAFKNWQSGLTEYNTVATSMTYQNWCVGKFVVLLIYFVHVATLFIRKAGYTE